MLPAAINGVMQRTLQASGAELTWITDAFLVPAAVLALTFGVVGDLYGRKKLVVGASLLTALGYVVSATSGTPAQLITGQAISGIGAAALFPTSLSMITAITTTPAARAKGLASWTTALSLGALVAPLLSGTIVEHTDFQWAFGVTGVIAVITAVAAWLLAAESSTPEGRSLDWPGQITIALAAMLTLLYGIVQDPSDGWGSAPVVLSFVAFVVSLAAFIAVENRSTSPMLRLGLFRTPAFAASAAMAVIGMFGFLGGAYDLSIRLGVIQHQSPFQAAVPFLIIQGITPFIWPLLVRLLHRVGPGPMLVTGFASLAVAQLWLRAVPVRETGLVPLLGPLVLNGLGFGLVVAALTAAVNVVPPTLTGMASATTSLVRDLGQTLGPAVVGAVALGMATTRLTGSLAGAGLTPKENGIAMAVLNAGGPLALHTADLGPLSAKLAPITSDALAHGYDNGLLLTAAACVVAAVIAAVFVGFRSRGTQPVGAEEDAV